MLSLIHRNVMPPQCFVCNLPILSHQVGLRWQGGSGVDDLLREQINMVGINDILKYF